MVVEGFDDARTDVRTYRRTKLVVKSLSRLKKSCNIVTTYVGGRTGNYTKFIYFFHGPNSSKSAKKFFCWWGWGVGGVVGMYLTSASSLHFIFEATA